MKNFNALLLNTSLISKSNVYHKQYQNLEQCDSLSSPSVESSRQSFSRLCHNFRNILYIPFICIMTIDDRKIFLEKHTKRNYRIPISFHLS